MATDSAIEIEQAIDAPREQIWDACGTLAGLTRWQADDASGEIHEGGQVVLRYPSFSAEIKLRVVQCVPRELLALKTERGLVEYRITDSGIRLRHSGREVSQEREGLVSSWRLSLAQLAHSIEHHAGQSRSVAWLSKPVLGHPNLIHACFTDSVCLDKWLGHGEVGPEGSHYEIENGDTLQLAGQVRVNFAGRDVALTCENLHDSMLILRTLPGSNSAERTVAVAWSIWGDHDTTWMLPTLEALENGLDELQKFLAKTGRD
ncbi:MAG TPA: SRPBCC domain-containing protein [Polyangiaceae bacterium]|nr:SRPBCC domain-containing protein [Polyangiaceae bacterium]